MTSTIVAAANAFLATLNASENASVLFDWTDTAQKQRWSNFPAVVGSNIALIPSFIGVQLGEYTDATGTTVRPLCDIEDQAFALINALDATQRQATILSSTLIELVLGPERDGTTLRPAGLPAAQMTADHQAALLTLIGHYTGLANDAAAAARLAEVQAALAQTYLAWYGPMTQGDEAYFRIVGPILVIEYAPQGSRETSQVDPRHIHGIYRDPTNDYGAKYTS